MLYLKGWDSTNFHQQAAHKFDLIWFGDKSKIIELPAALPSQAT